MELLLFLLLLPFARSAIFFFDWRFFVRATSHHRNYLAGSKSSASPEEKEKAGGSGAWLTENTTEIKRRVEKAGIRSPVYSFIEPKGYGYVGQEQMCALDNILYMNAEVQSGVVATLDRTRGHFKNQAVRNINPLYWVETILFLPKAIVSASGLDVSSRLMDVGLKVAQIIYWGLIIVSLILNPDLVRTAIENLRT